MKIEKLTTILVVEAIEPCLEFWVGRFGRPSRRRPRSPARSFSRWKIWRAVDDRRFAI
jgi:hypothetical protein